MRAKDLDHIRDAIECDGFHYAFVHYSDWEDVRDEEFQGLRAAYVRASFELAQYLGVEE